MVIYSKTKISINSIEILKSSGNLLLFFFLFLLLFYFLLLYYNEFGVSSLNPVPSQPFCNMAYAILRCCVWWLKYRLGVLPGVRPQREVSVSPIMSVVYLHFITNISAPFLGQGFDKSLFH